MSWNLQNQSLCLSTDFWGRVLKLLEPTLPTPALPQTGDSCEARLCTQSLFWQLPGMCKTFHSVFKAYPELGCQNVTVGALNRSERLTSTRVFLHSHAAAIRCLDTGPSSDYVMRYFEALSHIPDTLQTAKVQVRGTYQMRCLVPFTSLVSLSVRLDSDSAWYKRLDLSLLQQLHQLSHLSVDHADCDLPDITSLTHLELRSSSIECSYGDLAFGALAGRIVKMTIDCCSVRELHWRGLLGCTALQSLSLASYCDIPAHNRCQDCEFDQQTDQPHLPAGMSDLTALTHLQLHPQPYGCKAGTRVDFGSLLELACLQSLELTLPHPIAVDSTFSGLSLLTSLYIKAAETGQEYLHLSLDMQAMQSLQKLVVAGTFTASIGVLGLLLLQTIKHMKFRDSVPADDQTCGLLGQLEIGFVDHVDLLFEMNECDLAQYTMAQELQELQDSMSMPNAASVIDISRVASGPSDEEWLQWD